MFAGGTELAADQVQRTAIEDGRILISRVLFVGPNVEEQFAEEQHQRSEFKEEEQ